MYPITRSNSKATVYSDMMFEFKSGGRRNVARDRSAPPPKSGDSWVFEMVQFDGTKQSQEKQKPTNTSSSENLPSIIHSVPITEGVTSRDSTVEFSCGCGNDIYEAMYRSLFNEKEYEYLRKQQMSYVKPSMRRHFTVNDMLVP